MRALLYLVGSLCGLAGAAVLVLMLQYSASVVHAGAAAPLSMWAWHIGPGLVLLIGGVLLFGWARRLR